MKIDASGNYQTFEKNVDNIGFYINEFIGFTDLLKSLLRKDPETREAILNATYKEVLCLRVQAAEIRDCLRRLEENKIIQADASEAIEAYKEADFFYMVHK